MILRLLLLLPLLITHSCGDILGEEEENESGGGGQDIQAFFRDFRNPEYKYQATTQTLKDKDDNDLVIYNYEYNDNGLITKLVQQAETGLVAVTHQQSIVYTYNDANQPTSETRYTDAELTVKSVEITQEYENGVIKKQEEKSFGSDEEVQSTTTVSFDEFGNITKDETVESAGESERRSIIECTHDNPGQAFTREVCTTTVNDIKTREEVRDNPARSLKDTEFADADDTEGTKTFVATLLTGYDFVGDAEIYESSEAKVGTNIVSRDCEIIDGGSGQEASCVETTTDSDEKKVREETSVYSIKKLAFRYYNISYEAYWTMLKSFKRETYSTSSESILSRFTETNEYNDKMRITKKTERAESLAGEELEVDYVDQTDWTYDTEGDRIKELNKKRLEGEGDITGTVKAIFSYEE